MPAPAIRRKVPNCAMPVDELTAAIALIGKGLLELLTLKSLRVATASAKMAQEILGKVPDESTLGLSF